MNLTDLSLAIRDLGTKAVQRYCTITHSRNESAIPEIFLGGYIASHLYEKVRAPIHIERLYTRMARELDINVTPDLIDLMGGLRADMAIYECERPTHIVEFKIFDERNQAVQIATDLVKAKKLAALKPVAVVLGVMICQTTNSSVEQRKELLQHEFDANIELGKTQTSVGGGWEWSFGCLSQGAV
jgi:hypothetical protein